MSDREAFEKKFMPSYCHWDGTKYAPDDDYDPDSYQVAQRFNLAWQAWQAAQAQATCPHVVTSGTTSWCRLAQSSKAQAQAGGGEVFCDANCTWLDHHKDCALPLAWMRSEDAARTMIATEGERAEVAPDREDGFDVPLYITPPAAVNKQLPEGFTKWLDAFVEVSNASGIEDHETAWTWPNPPNNSEFFAGYPNLTTGDLRALHAIAAAQEAGNE